ncbi:unnamed protein product [Cuscuta campestris]|uniref:Uncharacterized protein n=1 Tax=Cuscuta campestris TaxID=132261 RepID=A0A484L5Q4_9ASTE|nr:unnamed protein product [Cuscuta campestris]
MNEFFVKPEAPDEKGAAEIAIGLLHARRRMTIDKDFTLIPKLHGIVHVIPRFFLITSELISYPLINLRVECVED